jgi:hypothetical protein
MHLGRTIAAGDHRDQSREDPRTRAPLARAGTAFEVFGLEDQADLDLGLLGAVFDLA